MLSIDTNILFHAFNVNSPKHTISYQWLCEQAMRDDIIISEFVLAELYRLVRNPVVCTTGALSAQQAVELVESYRNHPSWGVVGFSSESRAVHDKLWFLAKDSSFAYRKLFDVRTALCLREYGVTEFATHNLKDFQGLGFTKVWNPLA